MRNGSGRNGRKKNGINEEGLHLIIIALLESRSSKARGFAIRFVKAYKHQLVADIPLERVLHGGEEVVRYHRAVECPACAGSGAKAGTRPRPCEPCHGSGRRVATQQHGGVTWQQVSA